MLLVLFAFMAMSACSVFNPYKSEFSCPPTDLGKCVPVKAAYTESLHTPNTESSQGLSLFKQGLPDKPPAINPQELKQLNVTQKAAPLKVLHRISLINSEVDPNDSVIPLVRSTKVMRILFLPYQSKENVLFMERYVYIFTEDPKWVLGHE